MMENAPVQPTPVTPEPLFVAECVYTEEVWRRVCRISLQTPLNRIMNVLLAVMVGILALLCGVMLLFGDAEARRAVADVAILFPLLGLALGLGPLIARISAANQHKAHLTLYGQPKATRMWFYGDHLLEVDLLSGGQLTLPYATVKQVTVTPQLIVLTLPNRVFLPIERGRFLCGDPDGLVFLLKQQNPTLPLRLK